VHGGVARRHAEPAAPHRVAVREAQRRDDEHPQRAAEAADETRDPDRHHQQELDEQAQLEHERGRAPLPRAASGERARPLRQRQPEADRSHVGHREPGSEPGQREHDAAGDVDPSAGERGEHDGRDRHDREGDDRRREVLAGEHRARRDTADGVGPQRAAVDAELVEAAEDHEVARRAREQRAPRPERRARAYAEEDRAADAEHDAVHEHHAQARVPDDVAELFGGDTTDRGGGQREPVEEKTERRPVCPLPARRRRSARYDRQRPVEGPGPRPHQRRQERERHCPLGRAHEQPPAIRVRHRLAEHAGRRPSEHRHQRLDEVAPDASEAHEPQRLESHGEQRRDDDERVATSARRKP
jgi:hypothetical protein